MSLAGLDWRARGRRRRTSSRILMSWGIPKASLVSSYVNRKWWLSNPDHVIPERQREQGSWVAKKMQSLVLGRWSEGKE